MSVHEFALAVEDRHLDLFGHVNNAAYLEMFEAARWDWITGNGYGRKEILEWGAGPTILEIKLRFKREVRGKERVLIRSRTVDYRGKIGRMEQVMARSDGEIACAADLVFALFDLKDRKLLKPTRQWLKAVGLPPEAAP